MQLISVTYPSLHRVCECSIIEDGVDLWARRTLDSMTAGTVEDLVETVLYVARMYERSKCFERIYVNHIQMENRNTMLFSAISMTLTASTTSIESVMSSLPQIILRFLYFGKGTAKMVFLVR